MSQPQFIAPIVEWMIGILRDMTPPQGMEAFAEVRQSWTGITMNWPPAAVLARSSTFDPEIMGASHSQNDLTVKFGVNGSDPDQVVCDAFRYMQAIDAAIEAATQLPQISHVHIGQHDYGPLWAKDGSFAKFPELHVQVEVFE